MGVDQPLALGRELFAAQGGEGFKRRKLPSKIGVVDNRRLVDGDHLLHVPVEERQAVFEVLPRRFKGGAARHFREVNER